MTKINCRFCGKEFPQQKRLESHLILEHKEIEMPIKIAYYRALEKERQVVRKRRKNRVFAVLDIRKRDKRGGIPGKEKLVIFSSEYKGIKEPGFCRKCGDRTTVSYSFLKTNKGSEVILCGSCYRALTNQKS